MAKYLIDRETLMDIAEAIRTKKGTAELILAGNFAAEIKGIDGGDNETLKRLIDRSTTHIDIPSGITKIGDYVFRQFTTLKTVTIPEGVTSIGGGAFNSCTSLTAVVFPSTVTSIGGGAFAYCGSCKVFDFSSHETIPTIEADSFTGSFNGTNADAIIIIPFELYSTWAYTNGWKDYRDYIVTKGKTTVSANTSIDMVWIDGQSSWKSENFDDNPNASITPYCKKDGVEISLNDSTYFTNIRYEQSYDGSYLDYHFTTEEWDKPVQFHQAGLYEFGTINEDGKVTYKAYIEVTE